MKCLGEDKKLVSSQKKNKHLKDLFLPNIMSKMSNKIFAYHLKFLNGKLDPVETLKLMELVTQETPERMDKGFTAYTECSNIGTYYLKNEFHLI
jgi:hypothetical protein